MKDSDAERTEAAKSRRFDRRMTHIRIEAARESATAQGRTPRALEKGASMALYDMTRPKTLQKDIPELRKDTESELQETQQGIRQIGTQHYANVPAALKS